MQQPVAPTGKILVVDDNPIIQRAVYFQFREQGFKVIMAGDLTASIAMIRTEQPDVILLDINFPAEGTTAGARDGYWAIGHLRRTDDTKNIPIIVISTAKPEEVEPRALAAGAVAFFPKPIEKDKLLAKIQQLMAEKKSQSQSPPNSPPTLRMAS